VTNVHSTTVTGQAKKAVLLLRVEEYFLQQAAQSLSVKDSIQYHCKQNAVKRDGGKVAHDFNHTRLVDRATLNLEFTKVIKRKYSFVQEKRQNFE